MKDFFKCLFFVSLFIASGFLVVNYSLKIVERLGLRDSDSVSVLFVGIFVWLFSVTMEAGVLPKKGRAWFVKRALPVIGFISKIRTWRK
jgi:hypothetical protein